MLLLALGAAACNRTPTPGLARGEALFDTCVPCHGADGAGNQTLAAPSIAGLPRWYVQAQLEKFQVGHRGGTAFDTTGIRMKSMSRTLDLAGDLESVAEYVASLAPTGPAPTLEGGDAQAGQAPYQVCAACHGPDGKGNEAVHAPPLAGQSDWYLVSQLHKFKAGWRGANPADTWGATMRANALMLDDAAMANVVAYIRTLR
ncbi:MAG: c-type cytochrome [Longimicrobiales bacterium]|nr:c-type cytochrome [Longimicrobiales bacterium]